MKLMIIVFCFLLFTFNGYSQDSFTFKESEDQIVDSLVKLDSLADLKLHFKLVPEELEKLDAKIQFHLKNIEEKSNEALEESKAKGKWWKYSFRTLKYALFGAGAYLIADGYNKLQSILSIIQDPNQEASLWGRFIVQSVVVPISMVGFSVKGYSFVEDYYLKSKLLKSLWERLESHGIKMPFFRRLIYLRTHFEEQMKEVRCAYKLLEQNRGTSNIIEGGIE